MKKKIDVYFTENIDYKTIYGNIIQRIDDEKVRIILNPNSSYERELEKPQILGAIYAEIENKISELNPNINQIHTDYSDKSEIFYFSKNKDLCVKGEETNQKKALWIYFQKHNIKIQFSNAFKEDLIKFYEHNSKNFDKIFNTNKIEFYKNVNNNLKPNRRRINKLMRYTAENNASLYYAFQLVNLEAINFAFDFIKQTKLIS